MLTNIRRTFRWTRPSLLRCDEALLLCTGGAELLWHARIVGGGKSQAELSVDAAKCLLHRKIRCDGAEPCTNCSKSGRNCDYTPVPADPNATRRRRGFVDGADSVISMQRSSSEGTSGPRAAGLPASNGFTDAPPNQASFAANGPAGFNAQVYQQSATDSDASKGLLPSPFNYGPPSHPPSQGAPQMEWALVPVWRSSNSDQPPAPPLIHSPQGFAASRRTGTIPVPPPIMSGIRMPTQHMQTHHQAGKISGYCANSVNDTEHAGGLSAALSQPQPYSLRPATTDSMHNTGFPISEPTLPLQQSHYPMPSPSTRTSFSSSREFVGSTSAHTAASTTTTSPPYTPLPPNTITSRPSTSNASFNGGPSFAPEEVKHLYPSQPMMFMHYPPTTPGFASPNDGLHRPHVMTDTGMNPSVVGLGIMMPGM
jgi:hypothetical protein